MKMLMMMSMGTSGFYMTSSHPALLMLFILMQASLICVISWVKLKMSWFSYILFLVFLGGLMVLFIYIVSLASNEKIQPPTLFNPKNLFTAGVATLLLSSIQLTIPSNHQSTFKNTELFMDMYTAPITLITATAMIYLLLTLIVVVSVASKYEAPVKNMIY